MSEEYTFEQLCHFNWNDSLSLKSQKNMNFTMSDISKNDLQFQIFPQQNQQQWNMQEFNKKNAKKLKNKTNVKNFRQRQKLQQSKNQKKMKYLQEQNQRLKADKYCKHCKKPYGGYIQFNTTQHEKQQSTKKGNMIQSFSKQRVQSFQFQKPNFFRLKQQKKNNGKIWIALGILMLVLGIHLYGLNGKDGYQDISISKIQQQKWISIYENKPGKLHDQYFNIKMKMKQKNSKQIQKQKHMFRSIKIFNQQENQQKNKQYQSTTRQTIQKLQVMRENRNTKSSYQMDIEESKEDQIKFHKDFLFAIQAEIDQLGNYM